VSQLDRRTLLTAGGVLAAATLTGCSDSKPASAGPEGLTVAAPDWNSFRRGLTGRLYRPGETGYDTAHQLFNPRFDSIRPAGVVRISTVDDVRESVLFARKNKLVCVPKGGGHSYVGASTISNGLVVDVGAAHGVSYANNVVTVGAGAKLYDVHAFLDKYGRSLPT
jgi:FAD/FMN-containing dehydrogenase